MKLYFVNIQTNLRDEDVVWAVETGHIASVNKSDASVFGGREELKETNANMGEHAPHREALRPISESNPGPFRCEAGALTTHPPCCPKNLIC